MTGILIYGATGYTGQLAAEHAVTRGLRPILAGRDREKLQPLADRLGLQFRVFDLQSVEDTVHGLSGVSAVLHMAGPFSSTARPMAEACLRAGAHYIDITGEIGVFEELARRDQEAGAANIMLLPGAGFDVVPSDCLAAHVKRRLPTATRLRISIGGLGNVSRGTAKTMVESLQRGALVRRGGELIELKRPPRATADFGHGEQSTTGVSWGDVSTAWHSTRIPDIAVFFQTTRMLKLTAGAPRFVRRILATSPGQRFLKWQIDKWLPAGPTPEQRVRSRCVLVAEAWDDSGRSVSSRLETIEGYTLTARTAVEIARRASRGEVTSGYQTPSSAFGADFVLEFDGTERTDSIA